MRNKIGIVAIVVLALAAILVLLITRDKVAYIENTVLYAKFKGTQEIEKKNNALLMNEYNQIDTLNARLKNLEQEIMSTNDGAKKLLYLNISKKRDSLQYFYEYKMKNLKQEAYQQVWNTLNEYILEYGKKKRYTFIYGATGSGTLMYADRHKNITDDVVEFANEKYNDQ